jgi:serine/threonine protein kinase
MSGAPAPAPAPRTPTAFGKYQLVERLGRGGMAEVWKARIVGPAGFQRTLVVKRILPHLVEDEQFVKMFVAEARLSARLNHANIVQVFELGDVDGEYFLAMEYVRGRDLVSVMRAQILRGAPDPGLGAYVVRETCRALAYAHALTDDNGQPLRLIHRDVSPSNVMIAFDGAVKLLDFGIAKALSDTGDNKTQTGTLKGKFGYMSPEQVEGRPIDHRADLFACGVMLHETLTGRRLFKGGSDLQTIAMVREAKVEPPSHLNPLVPPELDVICLRALARDVADRYPSCDEMAAALDHVLHQLKWGPERTRTYLRELFPDEPSNTGSRHLEDLSPPVETSAERKKRRRRPLVAAIASALLVAGTTVAIVVLTRGPRDDRGTKPAVAAQPRASSVAPPVEPPKTTEPTPPPPTTTAAPPLPSEVRVRVQSTPPGADVFVAGEAEPRGKTPMQVPLPRGSEAIKIELRLKGYKSDTAMVTPDSDQTLQVKLVVAPPERPAAPAGSKRRSSSTKPAQDKGEKPAGPDLKRGDVIDPFAR